MILFFLTLIAMSLTLGNLITSGDPVFLVPLLVCIFIWYKTFKHLTNNDDNTPLGYN